MFKNKSLVPSSYVGKTVKRKGNVLSQLLTATRQSAQTIAVNYITIIYCLPVIQITMTLIEYDFLLLSPPDLKGKLTSRTKSILIK